jgi:hypothetical protein
VALLGATAIVARRHGLGGMWLGTGLLALVLWLHRSWSRRPTLGNLTRIVAFFAGASSSGQTFGAALAAWSAASTRVFTRDFAVALGFDFRPPDSSWPAVWAIASVIVLATAAMWTRARTDPSARWFATMCVLASAVAFAATTRIRGQIADHEIFWMSALGALNAGMIAGVIADAAATRSNATGRSSCGCRSRVTRRFWWPPPPASPACVTSSRDPVRSTITTWTC